eukprot:SAG31_NODE_19258_length_608_cov_0.691552_1_plen_149_part_10
MSADVVEFRRTSLEKYLRAAQVIPQVATSAPLLAFLRVPAPAHNEDDRLNGCIVLTGVPSNPARAIAHQFKQAFALPATPLVFRCPTAMADAQTQDAVVRLLPADHRIVAERMAASGVAGPITLFSCAQRWLLAYCFPHSPALDTGKQ